MKLRDHKFKFHYNNDDDDIVREFYNPVLSCAKIYKRAVGFFSSSTLVLIAEGLKNMIDNDGVIKLIISPNLSTEDIEAISLGYIAKNEAIDNYLISQVEFEDIYFDQYNLLAWLIYENRLEIRVVVRKDFSNYGIFHDKFGIICDSLDKVYFHGSMNESETALIDNYESFDVFLSWEESDAKRINNIESIFDSLWNGTSKKWISYEFPELLKKEILKYKSSKKPSFRLKKKLDIYKIPENVNLREYQKEAINNWFNNKCSGILEMATGTGKTITAICATVKLINHLNNKNIGCGLIIVVPYKSLLEQWDKELRMFGIYAIKCYEQRSLWDDNITDLILDFNRGVLNRMAIITTNSTFTSSNFQEKILGIKKNYILCVDEMHHLYGPTISKLLPENADFRLGLTATIPKKENSESKKVMEYFKNGILFTFGLDKAIESEYLTPYNYYPIFIELTDDEKLEYLELNKKISKVFSTNKDSEALKILINKRNRIIFNARNKISQLYILEDVIKSCENLIIYCGDSIENESRYVDRINRIIAYDYGIRTHTFTSRESKKDRENIIRMFKQNELQCLTAIKCLDEGIDIPQLDTAIILASNLDEKQFIQRRGRILRKYKDKKYANIYDFIVIPTLNKEEISILDEEELNMEKKIFNKEMKRYIEFARLAINKLDAYEKIIEISKLYE